ncbi:hypothetical protein MMC31_004292 [Peltigera leucophlebia]|nr:hypothetical protein [Peltigera leucophlebia]
MHLTLTQSASTFSLGRANQRKNGPIVSMKSLAVAAIVCEDECLSGLLQFMEIEDLVAELRRLMPNVLNYLHADNTQLNTAGRLEQKRSPRPQRIPKPNHNRLGLGDLVPPNFNLVASMTLTILPLSAFPSCPIRILVTASLPGPKSLKTNSNA